MYVAKGALGTQLAHRRLEGVDSLSASIAPGRNECA